MNSTQEIKSPILVNVRYMIKPGKRDEFLRKVTEEGIAGASRAEPGNIQYEYYIPVNSDNDLFLMELWASAEAITAHGQTAHYKRLQDMKKDYITDVTIEKYSLTALT